MCANATKTVTNRSEATVTFNKPSYVLDQPVHLRPLCAGDFASARADGRSCRLSRTIKKGSSDWICLEELGPDSEPG